MPAMVPIFRSNIIQNCGSIHALVDRMLRNCDSINYVKMYGRIIHVRLSSKLCVDQFNKLQHVVQDHLSQQL